jgi:hypothetical protein
LGYPPLTTVDTDIAVPTKLPVTGQDIRERLLAEGFAEEFMGDDRPQKSLASRHFFDAETRRRRDKRRERNKTPLCVASASLRQSHGANLTTATVRIANPAAFLAQKILIHSKRDRLDRAKDILYMHDTLEVSGARLSELQQLWRTGVAAQLHRRSASAVSKAASVLFGDLSDDLRGAAAISSERALSPEAIRAACHYGFAAVFS